jgi:hypothetical protein
MWIAFACIQTRRPFVLEKEGVRESQIAVVVAGLHLMHKSCKKCMFLNSCVCSFCMCADCRVHYVQLKLLPDAAV